MRRVLFVLPVLVFAAIAGYLFIALDRDPHTLPSALVDRPVPAFELPPLDGRVDAPANGEDGLSTPDLSGDGAKLVNVFASWCIPCLAEHPYLTALSASGVPLHGINYKDKPAAAAGWLAEHGDPYRRVGVDRDGRAAIEWGVYGVPETYVVDAEGVIRYRHVGPVTPEIVEGVLRPLLEEFGG